MLIARHFPSSHCFMALEHGGDRASGKIEKYTQENIISQLEHENVEIKKSLCGFTKVYNQ